MSLQEYEGKRRFQETPEPPPTVPAEAGRRFCVQRHHARHLHYDFRLEAEGVLKSWAVPRGPSMVAGEKRLAVQVEDHPVDYLFFEGVIPPGNYGAGTVMVWDLGTYEVLGDGDFAEQMRRGDLKLRLHGSKLRGDFALVHTRRPDDKGWLLIKKKDEFARPGWDIEDYAVSALTGRTQAEIGESPRPESGGADPTGGDGPRPPQARARGGPVKMPPQARRAPFPRSIRPMLARVGQPFSHPDWFFELKWDGIRALACGEEGQLRLVSRLGHSLSRSFPELLALPRRVRGQSFILDGEIVTLNAEGVPDFHRLQHRIHAQSPRSVAALTRSAPATYYLFDLLYLDGYDLREVPLEERRRLLYEILETDATFRISEAVEEQGEALFRAVQERGLEGVMAKHRHSPYEEKRSPYWLKIKAVRSTDCVIGGMTRPKGGRQHFGSLVLGQWEGDRLVHVGSVGSGFSQRQLAEVAEELRPLETSRCPFDPPPRLDDPIRCWVRPERVCEVKYSSWTPERLLRFPVFLRMRPDKDPRECVLEQEEEGRPGEAVEGAGPGVPAPAAEEAGATRAPAPAAEEAGAAWTPAPPVEEACTASAAAPAEEAGAAPTAAALSERLPAALAAPSEADRAAPAGGPRVRPPLLAPGSGERVVEVEGRVLKLTNLNKVLFPQDGYTKRDLINFYEQISEFLLPYLRDRPLSLRRYPDGIDAPYFFQKHPAQGYPPWLPRYTLVNSEGKEVETYLCQDRATLIYLANLACIDQNPWMSRLGSLDEPDFMLLDLDPQDCPFSMLVEAAHLLGQLLAELGLQGFPKLSGSRGIHIYVPLGPGYSFEQTRTLAHILARLAAGRRPELFTLHRLPDRRQKGRVYVDHPQNRRGSTIAAPYVVRAVPGARVATPLRWEELTPDLDPAAFNIRTIFPRLEKVGDVFAPVLTQRQRLEEAVGRLEGLLAGATPAEDPGDSRAKGGA